MASFKDILSEEVGDVEQLRVPTRVRKVSREDEPTLQQKLQRDHAASIKAEDLNYLTTSIRDWIAPRSRVEWHTDGFQPGVFKLLKAGSYPPDAEIDLHHLSVKEARERLWEFLRASIGDDLRTVLVCHGKGERSTPQAVLKSYVCQALTEHRDVLAYCTAPRGLGGLGATLVRLKKSENARETTRETLGFKSS